MRQRAATACWVGIMVMAVLGGCSDRNAETINIDGHSFDVPREHLIEARIPWLPQSKEKGLMFIINPKEPVQKQISVLIESTEVTCPSNQDLGSTALASTCQAAEKGGSGFREQGFELEKVYRCADDPTQWEYRMKDGEDQGDVVATCSAIADGNGLCHSLNTYGDLVYTVGLRDSEIARLPEIWAKVNELFSSWEAASSDA